MSKYNDYKNEWFEMWIEDKKSMLSTMFRNMASDLENGYDMTGKCITEQRQAIANYEKAYNDKLNRFATMTETEVDRYCFYDMLKNGVIE